MSKVRLEVSNGAPTPNLVLDLLGFKLILIFFIIYTVWMDDYRVALIF